MTPPRRTEAPSVDMSAREALIDLAHVGGLLSTVAADPQRLTPDFLRALARRVDRNTEALDRHVRASASAPAAAERLVGL